jgi:hypothetical protein
MILWGSVLCLEIAADRGGEEDKVAEAACSPSGLPPCELALSSRRLATSAKSLILGCK